MASWRITASTRGDHKLQELRDSLFFGFFSTPAIRTGPDKRFNQGPSSPQCSALVKQRTEVCTLDIGAQCLESAAEQQHSTA